MKQVELVQQSAGSAKKQQETECSGRVQRSGGSGIGVVQPMHATFQAR